MLRKSILISALALLGAPASAQPADAGLDMIQKMIFDGLATDPADDRGGWMNQMYALAGREDLIASTAQPGCAGLPGDPIAAIVERARATNIVIINENHASPRDRAFIARVLTALKDQGYSTYAAETFSPYENLDHEGVTAADGFYVNDTTFARTVGLARSLGYRLVAYEITQEQDDTLKKADPDASQINRREMAQTENLMRAIFRVSPEEKAVIHVGHAHVWERKRPGARGNEMWMAERLKAATSRDPLTIDQTACTAPAGPVAAAGVLADDGTVKPPETVDLLIGHAPLEFRDGRVAWRQNEGDRVTPVPPQFLGRADHVLIEARPEAAPADAVPLDRLLLRPGETLPLLLPPGRYRIEAFTAAGPIASPPAIVDVH